MFKRRTLFILGAGASHEARLPCGDQLALRISSKLDIEFNGYDISGPGDGELFSRFARTRQREINQFFQAARLIRDGIHLSNSIDDSIDDFLDLHRDNPNLILLAKATIAKCIIEAERDSLLSFDDSNADNTINFTNLHATWFAKFMKMLGKNVPRDQAASIFENVSFIVFNYDRCLEHFLHHAVRRLYGFTYQEAASICDEVQIEHPYGLVAPLRIESGSGTRFGQTDRNWIELASNIKTYTEQVLDGDMLESIRAQVERAECIVFLGCAFHEPNMLMLRPAETLKPVPVFSTGYGISDDDAETVVGAIGSIFKGSERGMVRFRNKLTCSGLFDNFSRTIIR